MSPNKRRSLRTPRKATVSPKTKSSPTPTPSRHQASLKGRRKSLSIPQEKSEVMVAENPGKELRVNLVRSIFKEAPKQLEMNVVAKEEGEKDSAQLPVSNGGVEEMEVCVVNPKEVRRLSVNLQKFVSDPVEMSEKKSQVSMSPKTSDKSTETPTANKGDFNIFEIIKKYVELPPKDNNNHSNDVENTKLHNGDVEGDEVLCPSSDESDDTDEKTQPSKVEDDDDVFITDCQDSSSNVAPKQSPTTARDFLDDAAEEGEEPEEDSSDGACEIPDYGEPICLSESESEPDDYDRSDSFICDDCDEDEEEEVADKKADQEGTSRDIIVHENVNLSEIKDESLQHTMKAVIHSLIVKKLMERRNNEERSEEINNEIDHWEVDSVDAMWYVEKMHVIPSDK